MQMGASTPGVVATVSGVVAAKQQLMCNPSSITPMQWPERSAQKVVGTLDVVLTKPMKLLSPS